MSSWETIHTTDLYAIIKCDSQRVPKYFRRHQKEKSIRMSLERIFFVMVMITPSCVYNFIQVQQMVCGEQTFRLCIIATFCNNSSVCDYPHQLSCVSSISILPPLYSSQERVRNHWYFLITSHRDSLVYVKELLICVYR